MQEVVWNTSHLDVRELSERAQQDLRAFDVIRADGLPCPLHEFPVSDLINGMCHVIRVPCSKYLVNAWRDTALTEPGWRRPYNEFRDFSEVVVPLKPGSASKWVISSSILGPHYFGKSWTSKIRMQELVPLILHAFAWDERRIQVSDIRKWSRDVSLRSSMACASTK